MLLTLLVFIKIPLSVFPWVFLWRSGVEVFWGFGAKIKPAFCDVWSVGVLSVELSDFHCGLSNVLAQYRLYH